MLTQPKVKARWWVGGIFMRCERQTKKMQRDLFLFFPYLIYFTYFARNVQEGQNDVESEGFLRCRLNATDIR